jgi:hypothetical protein
MRKEIVHFRTLHCSPDLLWRGDGFVIDHRHGDLRMLGTDEKKKLLFVPVVLIVCTGKPLNQQILKALHLPDRKPANTSRYRTSIDEFTLWKKTNSLLYPRYVLHDSG